MSREAFRQVGREVLNSNLDPEAWAQALSECRGTHDDALALYARIRAETITRAEAYHRERVLELESRRRGSFRDSNAVEVVAAPSLCVRPRGLAGALDAIFWHVLAAIGMAGCLLAARLLWPGLFGGIGVPSLVAVVVGLQVVPLAAWWAGSGPRGIVSYPGVAQLSAGVALLGSVLLAVKLLGGDGVRADRAERLAPRVESALAHEAVPAVEQEAADRDPTPAEPAGESVGRLAARP